MFGLKGHGFWEGNNQNGAVDKILKSWFPLIIRDGSEEIVTSDTGESIGRIHLVRCTEKMADVIQKQINMLNPNMEFETCLLTKHKDGSADIKKV